MRNKTLFSVILIICVILVSLIAFSSCNSGGGEKNSENNSENNSDNGVPSSEKITYTVNVVDYYGNPIKENGAVTLKNGENEFMGALVQGNSSIKAPAGDYSVVLDIPDSEYYIESEYEINGESPELTVKLYGKVSDKTSNIYITDKDISFLNIGAVYVHLDGIVADKDEDGNLLYEGERTYFLFNPTRAGIYKFSVVSNEEDVSIGYFGATYLIQNSNVASSTGENWIEVEVREDSISQGGFSYVIGITTSTAEDCVILVERDRDVPITPADLPWTEYGAEKVVSSFRFSYDNIKVNVVDLNIYDENLEVVFNKNDGYYHLGDENGPVIYIRITVESEYMPQSFKDISDLTRIGAYFYDEDGEFLRKESYNELINKYADACDTSTGLYPLDESLAYVIQNYGEYQDWWNYDSQKNIFDINGIKKPPVKNAWLFAACTVNEVNIGTSEGSPITVKKIGGASKIGAGETVYFKVDEVNIGVSVTVKMPSGIKIVYNGTEYTSDESGKVTFEMTDVMTFSVTASDTLESAGRIEYSYEYVR